MPASLVEVICDTNFLIHLATRRIKNIDNLDNSKSIVPFIVPDVVKNELVKLFNEIKEHIETSIKFYKKFQNNSY